MKASRLLSFLLFGLLAVAPSGCARLCAQSGGVGVFCPASPSNPLNRPPNIDSITVDPSKQFVPGVDVDFEALVFDPDGDDLFFEWDLNDDGRFESSGIAKAGEWTRTVSRVFDTPGIFRVRFRVTDFPQRLGAPGDVSTTRTIIVRESFDNPNSAPIAAFTVRPNPARPYETVQF